MQETDPPRLCTWQETCAIMAIPLGETRKYPVTEEL